MSDLIVLDRLSKELAEAKEPTEIERIEAKLDVFVKYAKKENVSNGIINYGIKLACDAGRKGGELVAVIERKTGNQHTSAIDQDDQKQTPLAELREKLTWAKMQRWDQLRVIPEQEYLAFWTHYPFVETDSIATKGKLYALGKRFKKRQVDPPPLPEGKFEVIVVDPPWPLQKIEREVRPNQQVWAYPDMTLDGIMAWKGAKQKAAADCWLFLWTAHKFLPNAFSILSGWGWKYLCTFVWHKPGGFQPIGMPQLNCEFCLCGKRGNAVFVNTKGLKVCFEAPREEHSKKPDSFFKMVANATEGRRLSMFERSERDGFVGWGDEYETDS